MNEPVGQFCHGIRGYGIICELYRWASKASLAQCACADATLLQLGNSVTLELCHPSATPQPKAKALGAAQEFNNKISSDVFGRRLAELQEEEEEDRRNEPSLSGSSGPESAAGHERKSRALHFLARPSSLRTGVAPLPGRVTGKA
ncbi:hypothetical protein AXG93_2116s1360 [Marchantia polymorpha subsp. ruderalis]|uniref:Uncharacterized protein n=1 Tax=Marchantia polymorpha subsp. ruderalis TaxID=1480154 RepID=A0A176VMI7_MARPO|nr:hypothetical protein AXG93_2116s1360 [Marchantia polymorpha subsp. ruderalis]